LIANPQGWAIAGADAAFACRDGCVSAGSEFVFGKELTGTPNLSSSVGQAEGKSTHPSYHCCDADGDVG
jgi:hypothetical protein